MLHIHLESSIHRLLNKDLVETLNKIHSEQTHLTARSRAGFYYKRKHYHSRFKDVSDKLEMQSKPLNPSLHEIMDIYLAKEEVIYKRIQCIYTYLTVTLIRMGTAEFTSWFPENLRKVLGIQPSQLTVRSVEPKDTYMSERISIDYDIGKEEFAMLIVDAVTSAV